MVTLNDAEASRLLGPRYAALVADVAAPRKDGQQSEKDFMAQVLRLLRECNWLTYHTYRSVKSAPGYPDVTAVRGTRCLFAELKTATGTLSAAQEQWLAALRAVPGVETYLWTPADWQEIVRVVA